MGRLTLRSTVVMCATALVIPCWTGDGAGMDGLSYLWKTVYVDVDGDGVDEPLELRTDEDVYHLGARNSAHGHVGILGSGPGWGLRYTAGTGEELLLDTGVRGGAHFYNSRKDFLEGACVVTEWEADKVLLRRSIDLTEGRAIMVFTLLNLTTDHIRQVLFASQNRFDDFVEATSPDGQTTLGWDGYDPYMPDSRAIFKILHLPKPDTFLLTACQYGITYAVWGPVDLCAGGDLQFALIPIWNDGLGTIDEVLRYLDGEVARYKSMQDEIIHPPTDCDEALLVDVKPRSCPNPLNVKSKGVLPVAILGTADLDVSEVDVTTIFLEGVAPMRSAIEDVAAPVGGAHRVSPGAILVGSAPVSRKSAPTSALTASAREVPEEVTAQSASWSTAADPCECTTEGPDGYEDLTLKFEKQAVVAAIGDASDRDTLELTLVAELADGTRLEGTDCVIIIDSEEQRMDEDLEGGIQLSSGARPEARQVTLFQNSPNPSSGNTLISFYVPEACRVSLTVCDATGRTIAVLEDATLPLGMHCREWRSTAASGVYYYKLSAAGVHLARKMVLVR